MLTRLVKALDALTRTGPEPARQAALTQLRIACARGADTLSGPDKDRLRRVVEGLGASAILTSAAPQTDAAPDQAS